MKAVCIALGAILHVLLFVIGFSIALRIEKAHRDQQQQQDEQILSSSSSSYLELPEEGDAAAVSNISAKNPPLTLKDQAWLAFKVLCSQFGIFLLDIFEKLNGNSTVSEWSWSISWTLIYSFLSAFLWFFALWKKAQAEYPIVNKHAGTGVIFMGLWSFNLAGTATSGMILWGLSSDTDEDTMLYSSSSDTEEELMKRNKWLCYEFLSTIALFLTVFMTVRNWFGSTKDIKKAATKACSGLQDDDRYLTSSTNLDNNNGGQRRSVVFREELNECFRIGGSKSGDLTASFSIEETG